MSQPAPAILEWTLAKEPARHGGYVAWEAQHRTKLSANDVWYLPVFVQLTRVKDGPANMVAAINQVLASDLFLMARDERDLLVTEAGLADTGWAGDLRFVAYVVATDLGEIPAWCQVRHVGAPVPMSRARMIGRPDHTDTPFRLPTAAAASDQRPPTIVAAIDDGIAFLNARFRSDPAHTRIAAVWLQTAELRDLSGVLCGGVLDKDEIDALLAGGEPEAEVYRAINRTIGPTTEQWSTSHLVSHGTHVLDLAAGAAPEGDADAAMRALPILAVQLPPAALRDTSGRRLEGYVAQGVRWLMAQTLRRAGGGPVAPLVVNLSLGSLAGPGNASAFLAEWFQYEVQRYARLAPHAVLRIVAAYGNARRARLVARTELRAAKELTLDWRILPDDHTPSFVELRAYNSSAGALRLSLHPPGALASFDDVPWPEPGQSWSIGTPPVAMVTGVAEDEHRMVHVAVAPTAGAATLSQPGCWRIAVTRADEAPALISVRVQRDDTPAGYRTFGRQSWLDHPQAWHWDDETRDWTFPLATEAGFDNSPVTREGTAVAFSGTTEPAVLFVGSVRPRTGHPGSFEPALYTASGVVTFQLPGKSTGPTLAARGDDGAVLRGRRASGVLSGSVARLSGTSVAAPAVARALALYLDQTGGPSTPADELAALLGMAPGERKSPLTGHGVLVEAGAAVPVA